LSRRQHLLGGPFLHPRYRDVRHDGALRHPRCRDGSRRHLPDRRRDGRGSARHLHRERRHPLRRRALRGRPPFLLRRNDPGRARNGAEEQLTVMIAAVPSSNRVPDLSRVARVDEVGVKERVARFQSRSIKNESKVQALKMVLSMIDLTTLEGQDTGGKVRQLCQKAMHLHDKLTGLPHVAAVCVYPTMVAVAKEALRLSDIKVASVATAFPSGMAPRQIKLEETRIAVGDGADEIDMVISRGAFLQGEYGYVFDEIAAIKDACGSAHLKVILETGELGTLDRVRRAS